MNHGLDHPVMLIAKQHIEESASLPFSAPYLDLQGESASSSTYACCALLQVS
jgi:hypothetical protein